MENKIGRSIGALRDFADSHQWKPIAVSMIERILHGLVCSICIVHRIGFIFTANPIIISAIDFGF